MACLPSNLARGPLRVESTKAAPLKERCLLSTRWNEGTTDAFDARRLAWVAIAVPVLAGCARRVLRVRGAGHRREPVIGSSCASGGQDAGTGDEASRIPGIGRAAVKQRRVRLFTPDDKSRLHTILGVACLLHAMVRIGLLLCGVREMGFRGDALTLGCIAMHVALGASAFKFRVPKRRGKDGTQIWQEYREHNAIFTLRALTCMLCAWAEDCFGLQRLWYVRVAALYCQLFAADAISRRHALNVTTLAGAPFAPRLRTFLAFFQLFAGSNLLFGNGFWQQFSVAFAIQLTAFILTLNRRRLISPKAVVALYTGLLLVVNQLVMMELFRLRDTTVLCWGAIAILLRLGLGLNKYVSWTALLAMAAFHDPNLFFVGDGGGARAWAPAL